MHLFGPTFLLYFLKLSVGNGFFKSMFGYFYRFFWASTALLYLSQGIKRLISF